MPEGWDAPWWAYVLAFLAVFAAWTLLSVLAMYGAK